MRRLLILAVLIPTLASAEPCFPESAQSDAPSGDFSVEWQAPTGGKTHHLLLRNKGNPAPAQPFVEFYRSACIVCEPNGKRFALVMNSESNAATTLIYKTSKLSHQVEIASYFSQANRTRLDRFGHLYIRAVTWTVQDLTIEITGHEDREHGMAIHETVKCKPQDEGFACDA